MTMVFNGGTRTQAAPYGTLKLQREIIGNRQVQQAKRLIDALIRNNIPFTLENPHDSYIWHSPELLEIAAHPQAQVARFDQCMYKLRPPDYDGSSDVRVRKRTRLLGTLAQLPTLSVLCDKCHGHIVAFGSVRINGRRVVRASAAGAYPLSLCRAIARLVAQAVPSL